MFSAPPCSIRGEIGVVCTTPSVLVGADWGCPVYIWLLQSQCDYALAAYDKCCEAAIKKHGSPGESSGLIKPANLK
eukprot:4404843-Pyramimonas_sp.AAC.1